MPVSHSLDGNRNWRKLTPGRELFQWIAWLLLVAFCVFCWQIMTKDTIWAFIYDAPRQGSDILSRAFPPRLFYVSELITRFGTRLIWQRWGRLLALFWRCL